MWAYFSQKKPGGFGSWCGSLLQKATSSGQKTFTASSCWPLRFLTSQFLMVLLTLPLPSYDLRWWKQQSYGTPSHCHCTILSLLLSAVWLHELDRATWLNWSLNWFAEPLLAAETSPHLLATQRSPTLTFEKPLHLSTPVFFQSLLASLQK